MNADAVLAASEGQITPLAAVDEDVMERNLAAMAALAAAAGVALRPHAKTHKSGFVARRQLAHGAAGLTCATLREAEVFAAAGVEDLLLAHPPVGEVKSRRLAALAGRVPRLAVAVDSLEAAAFAAAPVELVWEVDSGLHRMGTAPGAATAEAVLRLLERVGPERVRGLLTHGGHVYRVGAPEERRAAAAQEAEALLDSAERLRAAGFEPRLLSVGSTPTAEFAGAQGGINEIRPGTYVFGDANQVALGSQRLEDCALAVVATVVAVHPDRAVIDAGSKAISNDLRVAGVSGWGSVLGHPELVLDRLSEEHGVLTGAIGPLRVGARLAVVPNHVCTTVNLHSELLFTGSGWQPVEARGWR